MSRQYNNFVKKLELYNSQLLTTLDDYTKDKYFNDSPEFLIQCKNGHQFTMRVASLSNKLKKLSNENSDKICVMCTKPVMSGEETAARNKCEELGFEFISYDKKTRQVKYTCVCGVNTNTYVTNLIRKDRKSQCSACQNIANRNSYAKVKKTFEDEGCELLSKEYTSRHIPLRYRCSCGNISKIRYADFVREKRCIKCKPIKYKETCQEKYGVDNIFQLESIKEKSRATCKEKYGFEHCMQNKEIKKRSEDTCMKKYGVKWTFTLPEVYERIRATHKKKYGVEYPLQCKEIQDKIEKVCLERYGVRRYFMYEKYLEQYYTVMMHRYGVKHACQVPEFFHKAMKSAFTRKKYTAPDGIIWYVLGYEHRCLDLLIKEEGLETTEIRAGDDEIPVCDYISSDGKDHRWYPDIWIPAQGRLIEVKSTWTYNLAPQKLKDKMDCCDEYDCETWIFDQKTLIEIIYRSVETGEYSYKFGGVVEIGVPWKKA